MAYTPLATVANLTATPLAAIVRSFSAGEEQNLLIRASRAIEAACDRHLSPFTGLVETTRAQAIDPDEMVDAYTPLDEQGALGMSRAQSLGAGELVRQAWLREAPPRWPELWTGPGGTGAAIQSITILRAFSGSQTIVPNTVQFEPDTGHVRFVLGTFIPQGSTLVFAYSGGYNPVPDDLIQATIWKAAELALIDMEPASRPEVDLVELREGIATLIAPYVR